MLHDATRCVTALPHFRIVLSRPASSPHFGEGIDNKDTNSYGSLADYPAQVSYPEHYAEHYVDMGLWNTDALLSNAFNFDITGWINANRIDPNGLHTGHHWPRRWYQNSVTSSGFEYGFPLSLEGGGSARFKELANKWSVSNPPQPCILKNTTTENPPSCDFKNASLPAPVPTPRRP
jgi:hypothetical protein